MLDQASLCQNNGKQMRADSEEHELLLAAKAVEQHLISPQDLARAVARWTDDTSAGLLSSIEEECTLTDESLEELRKLFREFQGQSVAAVAESIEDSFFGVLNDALGDVELDRLQATVTKYQKSDSIPLPMISENDRFRIISEHARGGLGEVLLAKDLQLNRRVALKRIREKWSAQDSARIRFQQEAEITGRLEHPGVVPVYALGQREDGEIYYAMRFIRGDSLEQAVDRYHASRTGAVSLRSADFRDLLQRFIDVCNTISYAHSRGIMHRDLKPANIMLGNFGETLVVDWGLAKPIGATEESTMPDYGESQIISDIGSGSAPTQIGSAVGTPQFMSPEQATGRLERMGPHTDVFGLGATFYYVLTGKPPQPGDSLPEILDRVEHGEFANPTEVVPSVPRPLESICLKAMERNPSARYETAAALAADVGNAVVGQRVSSHRERGFERMKRWAIDNRFLAQVLAMIVLLIVVGASAWSTAAVIHRRAAKTQRIDSLVSQADLKQRLVKNSIEHLRQDMLLLSNRPQLAEAAVAIESGDASDAVTDALAAEFEAILGLNPSYMQVRLIGTDGFEKVRVDRDSRGGLPFRLEAAKLQDKGGKSYFRDTRGLKAGDVYLSEININMEQGRHQWETPTIRAAAPVLSKDAAFLGAVVVNMHFGEVTEQLIPQSEGSELLVYLTDEQGRFLFAADAPDVDFCFERGLVFPIDSVYHQLGNFRAATSAKQMTLGEASPKSTVIVSSGDEFSTSAAEAAEQMMNDSSDIQVRVSRYEGDDTGVGMLIATSESPSSLTAAVQQLSGKDLQDSELAHSMSQRQQALCAWKIFFDPARPERFLCLVLAQPY